MASPTRPPRIGHLKVTIPPGVEDGKQIRLRGQGRPGGRNAPAGDAIVTIHYAPHPLFRVEGRDLKLDLPITLYEAVLGAKVRTPTLSGEVEIAIPAGTSSGRVLRLRGNSPATVDEKGRLKLPSTFKADLESFAQSEGGGELRFYLTSLDRISARLPRHLEFLDRLDDRTGR